MESKLIEHVVEEKLDRDRRITFDDAYRFLTQVMPSSPKEIFQQGKGIERSRYFLDTLDNPQDAFPAIHIAGTSGKGSTSHILTDLLAAHGMNVGTHTSPHVYNIRERCQINGKLCSKRQFTDNVELILPAIFQMTTSPYGRPTYFETTNAIAFTAFRDAAVNYGVIETGLGGLYDSTNTINREDKLAVITSLGFDHTEILGNTLADIAAQKAGILPRNGQSVVLLPQDTDAKHTIQRIAEERNTNITWVDPSWMTIHKADLSGSTFTYDDGSRQFEGMHLSLVGKHQVENATVAIKTFLVLADRDGIPVDSIKVQAALDSIKVPGRFEAIQAFDKTVLLDGAHNSQKLQALIDSFSDMELDCSTWVLALKKTKDVRAIMETLKPVVKHLVITQFFASQDGLPTHLTMPPEEIARSAHTAGIRDVHVLHDNLEALQVACGLAEADDPVVVSGSFYLIGELHSRLVNHGII